MAKDVRDRLGLFCNQLARWPSLDAIVRDAGACRELDELLAAISGAGPEPERAGMLLDAIDEACRHRGLEGITRVGFQPLPKGMSVSSVAEGWVCPRGFCDRVVLAEESDEPPLCVALGGTPMKRYPSSP